MKVTKKIINSARIYHWPIIFLNTCTMGYATGVALQAELMVGLSISLAASYGFLINDLCDVRADSINGADRLQNLSPKSITLIKIICYMLFVFSVLVSLVVGIKALFLCTVLLIALTLYSLKIRKTLVANILCAFICISPLWIPYALGHAESLFLVLIIISAFFLIMVREIVFDINDIEGDKADYRKSIPIAYGINIAKATGSISLLLGILCLLIAGLSVVHQIDWTGTILLCVIFLIFSASFLDPFIKLSKNWSPDRYRSFSKWTRYAMLIFPAVILMYSII